MKQARKHFILMKIVRRNRQKFLKINSLLFSPNEGIRLYDTGANENSTNA